MINIKFNPNDLRYMFLYGDKNELKTLEGYLNKIPQYMFLPSFRGYPKPEVFLNKMKTKTKNGEVAYYCFSGLWKTITNFLDSKHIERSKIDTQYILYDFKLSLGDFQKEVDSWDLNIKPRDYQVRSAWMILKFRQSLSQLATRAGKTLISYMVFRYMLSHGAHNILMIVPNVSLVKQAVSDMKEYKEFFKSETVWADGEFAVDANLTIGTFQSLVRKTDKKNKKYDPEFFKKFDVLLIDEAHTSKCESIKQILSQDFMKNIKIKFGFSGSLPEEDTIDSFACHSLLGPTIQDIRSIELMEEGFITPVEITQIRINYEETPELISEYIKCGEYLNGNDTGKTLPKEQQSFTMKQEKRLPYAISKLKDIYEPKEYMSYLVDLCKAKGSNLLLLEQMLVHRSKKRLDVMDDILKKIDKNTIVFGHHTEYLKFLEQHFKETFPNRPVYLIQGSTSIKKRDDIINKLLKDKGAILVASYGCVGTGLTLKNLDYGIFAQSFKSQIINKQSIGRGLCLANDKDKYRLYDLIDCFPTGKLKMQGVAKAKLYKKEQFEFSIREI